MAHALHDNRQEVLVRFVLLSSLLAITAPALAACELESAKLSVDQRTWNLGDRSYKLARRDDRAAFELALSECVGRDTWNAYYEWRTWQLRGQTTAVTGAAITPLIVVALPLATVGVLQVAGPATRHQTSFEELLRADLAAPPVTPVSADLVQRDQKAMRRQRTRAVVIPVATAVTVYSALALTFATLEIL